MGIVTPGCGSVDAGRPSLTQWRVLERGWFEGSQLVATPPPQQRKEELSAMSVVELKKELQVLGLQVSGKKADLQERLSTASSSQISSAQCSGRGLRVSILVKLLHYLTCEVDIQVFASLEIYFSATTCNVNSFLSNICMLSLRRWPAMRTRGADSSDGASASAEAAHGLHPTPHSR